MPAPAWLALIPALETVINKFVPDKDKANELAHSVATMAENHSHANAMAQIEVNKQEAQHGSLFVAGARPFILWVCGVSFAFNYLVLPILNFGLLVAKVRMEVVNAEGKFVEVTAQLPPLDFTTMMPVMMGLLGLGAYRSYEKARGVARTKLGVAPS